VGDLTSIIELMDSRIKNLSDRVDELILANKETAQVSYRINENFITKLYTKVLNLLN
jgi:AICAR transformylase/IMP cyclohydrolase PurH